MPNNREVEQGLLSLMRFLDRPERPRKIARQFAWPDVSTPTPAAAVDQVAGACRLGVGPPTHPVDVTAAIDAMALGGRLLRRDEDDALSASLQSLAQGLLAEVGADPARAGDLVDTVRGLASARVTSRAHVDAVSDAFGDTVQVAATSRHPGTVTVTGRAARVAAQVLDLSARRRTECHADFPMTPDHETGQQVTVVRLEACTALPFAECRARIDPSAWAQCNPYFRRVDTLERHPTPDGWWGAIREQVGPGLNRSYYTTDLDVRYHEERGLAFAAFDLREPARRHDDGRVTVDRGCVGVIDEGPHRRVQMVKVYRIDDLDAPHDWVCQLWASQFVTSGWSCNWTGPVRRALAAWTAVEDLVVDLAGAVYDVSTKTWGEPAPPAKDRPPLGGESYEIPIDTGCDGSWDADFETTAKVPIPPPASSQHLVVGQARRLTPGQAATQLHPVSVPSTIAGGMPDVVLDLSTGPGTTVAPGLYVGRLRDGSGHLDAPYSVYVTGVHGP